MSGKAKILYSGFHDFPLAFTVRWEGRLFLFFREFDDEQDDYEDRYRIFLLPFLTDDEIEASWGHIETRAVERLGEVAVKDVLFDPTRRREISTATLQALTVPRELVAEFVGVGQ